MSWRKNFRGCVPPQKKVDRKLASGKTGLKQTRKLGWRVNEQSIEMVDVHMEIALENSDLALH